MVKYLIDHDAIAGARGNAIWQQMIKNDVNMRGDFSFKTVESISMMKIFFFLRFVSVPDAQDVSVSE